MILNLTLSGFHIISKIQEAAKPKTTKRRQLLSSGQFRGELNCSIRRLKIRQFGLDKQVLDPHYAFINHEAVSCQ